MYAGVVNSYRGSYDELALGYRDWDGVNHDDVKLKDFLARHQRNISDLNMSLKITAPSITSQVINKVSGIKEHLNGLIPFTKKVNIDNVNIDTNSLKATSKITFIFGNHEWRLDRFILNNAPMVWGLLSLKNFMELDRFEIDYLEYNDAYRVHDSNLFIQHTTVRFNTWRIFFI